MKADIKEYKNLTNLLLGAVRERPALFITEAKISKLTNFITGYHIGVHMTMNSNEPQDRYFANPGFISWFFDKYKVESPTFERPFLEEANGDEKKALDIFFNYLEEYSQFINANP